MRFKFIKTTATTYCKDNFDETLKWRILSKIIISSSPANCFNINLCMLHLFIYLNSKLEFKSSLSLRNAHVLLYNLVKFLNLCENLSETLSITLNS